MRKTFAAVALALALAASARADEQIYQLDRPHAELSFAIRRFGVVLRSGAFRDFDATLALDREQPDAARLSVMVQAASLDAGAGTASLLRMFEVGQYPTIQFVSTRIVRRSATEARIEGLLTLHGVTQPIVLTAAIDAAAPLRFRATGSFRRSAFGLKDWPWAGDRVGLTIQAPFSPIRDPQ